MLNLLVYFIFVHIVILIPGYVIIKKANLFKDNQGIALLSAYLISLALLGLEATLYYIFNLPNVLLQTINWLVIIFSLIIFFRDKIFKDLLKVSYPLIILVLMSLSSLIFISLDLSNSRGIVPDPEKKDNRNYNVLNVKILNLANTPANDNYIPYRQAQFFVNRSDPAKDSFIDEWGVHFFQRTPMMGAVTSAFFITLDDSPPIDYSWNINALDTDNTYAKFQIIAQILNSLLVIPAFYIFKKLFSFKTAAIGLIFIATSQFYLYNSFFSWPKSFVAFFILFSWLLILENKMKYVVFAGLVSGIAYLTHDLAILYIGASFILLLLNKQFKKLLVFTGSTIALMIPWVFTSGVIYNKPSSFIYYPFSIHGIPQAGNGKEIIKEFFHTPITKIMSIKLDSLSFLLTPYSLVFKDTLQSFVIRFWAVGIFSIPGAIGFGLMLPSVIGLFKKMKEKKSLLIFSFVPILLSVLFMGYPKGLGALHFAEASIIIFIGIGIAFLIGLKHRFWLIAAYLLHICQFGYFTLYTYNFGVGNWLKSPSSILQISLLVIFGISCLVAIIYIQDNKRSQFLNRFIGN